MHSIPHSPPPHKSFCSLAWPHSSLDSASFLFPSFVSSGLSTIRNNFSIAFVSASSSISVSSLQPSAASYDTRWWLYLNISYTTPPIRLYAGDFCRNHSLPSTFCTCYIVSLVPSQPTDVVPQVRGIFSQASRLSYNNLRFVLFLSFP